MKENDKNVDIRVIHLTKVLSEKLDHNWTVPEMAGIVHLSPTRFSRVFKLHLGIPPIGYLNEIRLELARTMLADPTCFLQIKEIGTIVGLTDDRS